MVDDLCDCAVWSFLCLDLHFGICTTSSLVWRILLEGDRVPRDKKDTTRLWAGHSGVP